MKKRSLYLALFTSLLAHFGVLVPQLKTNFFDIFKVTQEKPQPMNLRIVGQDQGEKKDLIFIQPKVKKKKIIAKNALRQQLSVPDLSALDQRINKMIEQKNTAKNGFKVKKAIDNLRINNGKIKEYLKSNSFRSQPPRELLSALDDADVLFDLQVPKGVKEDELNKHEMVFYSFRKRTAIAYVNSFYKELNSFERKNPHLRFPLTQEKQQIAGKITYDKNGDILRIDTLKWTDITKLQDFFIDVLKNMSSLPNPPEAIINQDDEFVINFVLTVNG